jgi:hypothetical protein
MQDYIKRILIHSLAILIENGVNGSDNLGQPGVGGCMRAVDNWMPLATGMVVKGYDCWDCHEQNSWNEKKKKNKNKINKWGWKKNYSE